MFYRFFICFFFAIPYAVANPSLALQCLKESYPNHTISITFSKIPKHNTSQEYENALIKGSLIESFAYVYPLGFHTLEPFKDSSRIRDYRFLASIYGENQNAVESHLKSMTWIDGSQILFNSKNDAYKALERVKTYLEQAIKKNPSLLIYLQNIGGTYKWRKIANTDRLSAHSFGIAIDINVAKSRYWLWDLKQKTFKDFTPKIPLEIILAFEQEGFIWGGRWWHYDTMHFEYRPEILCYAKALKDRI
ncbi:M15 family metallopeptidase [Helicobacter winghamensis]|uniref:M15 family metallopeptidase n=1 Tax=Helicobacter winghamensis TaxID=157268 RepID=UPI0018D42966|nr:M15 family metallopeptidase [Helicobacter winghamensis]